MPFKMPALSVPKGEELQTNEGFLSLLCSWNATLVAAAIAHDRTGLGVSEGQRPPWDQGLGRDKLVERMYQRTTMGR
jgi:hypothetical protein